MKTSQAKQFLELDGMPILMHTIKAFENCVLKPQILLVINIDQHQYWDELCTKYNFTVLHQVIKGGEQRYHSVKNGLKTIKGEGIVAVHDAVRPLISAELIQRSFESAEKFGNAVAAIHPTDSVRVEQHGTNKALNRDELYLIQTPQAFQLKQLRKAYQEPYRNEFTDDASVTEHAGFAIHLIEGERENLKITYPMDLEIASLLMKKKASE